jgi:hypothetical protein
MFIKIVIFLSADSELTQRKKVEKHNVCDGRFKVLPENFMKI